MVCNGIAACGDWRIAAFESGIGIAISMREARPITLHAPPIFRTDCNSPVLVDQNGATAFVSHFLPIGHSNRIAGRSLLNLRGPPVPVRILDDPDPGLGKWIESAWRAPDGRLFGWYHAEARAPCEDRLMTAHIGAIVSADDGAHWRILGDVLRMPPEAVDCSFRNGSMAGGVGDFTCVPGVDEQHFHLHFTSYHPDPAAQGVCTARYPVADRERSPLPVEIWTASGWRRAATALPRPIVPPIRGWRHVDADAAWGPAVHWNTALGLHVMLLNRTRGGHGDMVQAGVEIAFNDDLDRPDRWTAPLPLVTGGIWYPQVAGAAPGEGDRGAGEIARFFLSGFSAWEMRFERSWTAPARVVPYAIPESDIAQIFGPRRSDGGFGPAQ